LHLIAVCRRRFENVCISDRPKLQLSPASWLFGPLLLVAVVMVARRFKDAGQLAALLQSANPWWLLFHTLAIAVIAMLAIFWHLRELTVAVLVPATIFIVPIGLACLIVFWLGERARGVLSPRLLQLPVLGAALQSLREGSSTGIWKPVLVSQTTVLELAILLCDAATQGYCLQSAPIVRRGSSSPASGPRLSWP
jgi:hypothetical protein